MLHLEEFLDSAMIRPKNAKSKAESESEKVAEYLANRIQIRIFGLSWVNSQLGDALGPGCSFVSAPAPEQDKVRSAAGGGADSDSFVHLCQGLSSYVSSSSSFGSVDMKVFHGSALCGRAGAGYYLRQWPESLLPVCPLLVMKDGEVLCRSQVVSAIKWLVAQLGLDLTQYVGHSLWQGGAMSAAVAGLSPAVIQQMGGWRSDTWQRYIQIPNMELAVQAMEMGWFPVRSLVAGSDHGGCASLEGWMASFNDI